MSFSKLKSTTAGLTDKLKEQMKTQSEGGYSKDERFWQPTKDTAGNAYALIRFLPPPPNKAMESGVEDAFYVKTQSHFFKNPKNNRYYVENSRRTLGEEDPANDYARSLWDIGTDESKKEYSRVRARTEFISNVFIVNDTGNPKNNGKVFLYKFGKKIFDKINDKMNPKFEDETSVNVFDLWKGADFKLKVTKVDGFPNYDKSEFAAPTELLDGDDKKLEAVWNAQHSLQQFLDPSQFKPFDVLKKKLDEVLGNTPSRYVPGATSKAAAVDDGEDDNEDEEAPTVKSSTKISDPSSDDEELEFFKRVAGQK